jgi:lysophospholipase L1-like esterase
MKKKFLFYCTVLLLVASTAAAQLALPFAKEINAFKHSDSTQLPPKNAILFVGSSSFTKWTDVQSYFPEIPIINRGFGGSTLLEVMLYADDVIFPYAPKQIVIYCGENDIASSDSMTAIQVAYRAIALFDMIRKVWPNKPIAFVSIKPSISRERFMPKIVEANNIISTYLATKMNAVFIDVYSKMLTPAGKPMPDIFIEDKLHMNAKGYAIWQKVIGPYLLK